jgi:hypothetical protein
MDTTRLKQLREAMRARIEVTRILMSDAAKAIDQAEETIANARLVLTRSAITVGLIPGEQPARAASAERSRGGGSPRISTTGPLPDPRSQMATDPPGSPATTAATTP